MATFELSSYKVHITRLEPRNLRTGLDRNQMSRICRPLRNNENCNLQTIEDRLKNPTAPI